MFSRGFLLGRAGDSVIISRSDDECDMGKLSKREICSKFITPALISAGWDLQVQIRKEVSFTQRAHHRAGQAAQQGERQACRLASTLTETALEAA